MLNDVKDLLTKIDVDLSQIHVSGDDVFILARTRNLLKAAFDAIPNDDKPGTVDPAAMKRGKKEGAENGG